MQTRNKLFEDLGQIMQSALGVAQGAREEAEATFKGWMDRWMADRGYVTMEEFEALAARLSKTEEALAGVQERLAALEAGAKPAAGGRTSRKAAARKTAARTAAAKKAGKDAAGGGEAAG